MAFTPVPLGTAGQYFTDDMWNAAAAALTELQVGEINASPTPSANASESLSIVKTQLIGASDSVLTLVMGGINNVKGSAWAGGDLLVTFPEDWRPAGPVFLIGFNISVTPIAAIRFTLDSDGTLKHTAGTVNNGNAVYFMSAPFMVPR